MLIRSLPTTLLEFFSKIILNLKVIVKSILDPDDNCRRILSVNGLKQALPPSANSVEYSCGDEYYIYAVLNIWCLLQCSNQSVQMGDCPMLDPTKLNPKLRRQGFLHVLDIPRINPSCKAISCNPL